MKDQLLLLNKIINLYLIPIVGLAIIFLAVITSCTGDIEPLEEACKSNFKRSDKDSLLASFLLKNKCEEILLQKIDSTSSDALIGMSSICYTFNAQPAKAIETLPICLQEQVESYNNRTVPKRVENIGFWQNSALWLHYYMYQLQDDELIYRIYYNVSFHSGNDSIKLFNQINRRSLSLHRSGEKSRDLLYAGFEEYDFDSYLSKYENWNWIKWLKFKNEYEISKDIDAFRDSIDYLIKQDFSKEFLLEEAMYAEIFNSDTIREAEITKIIDHFDKVYPNRCCLPKIMYYEYVGKSIESECKKCIRRGGQTDSIVSSAKLARFYSEIGKVEQANLLINRYQNTYRRKIYYDDFFCMNMVYIWMQSLNHYLEKESTETSCL